MEIQKAVTIKKKEKKEKKGPKEMRIKELYDTQ